MVTLTKDLQVSITSSSLLEVSSILFRHRQVYYSARRKQNYKLLEPGRK